jgi:hypothetical protein
MRHTAASCFPFESKRTSDRFQPGYAGASALQVAPSALALNNLSRKICRRNKAVGGAARTGNVWMHCAVTAMLPIQLLTTWENPGRTDGG